jgi:hypothetical protein
VVKLREATPVGNGWKEVPGLDQGSAWQRGRVRVISTLDLAEMPDGNGTGPQWHISISDRGARPDDTLVRRALTSFDMLGAEEDNHHPGNARHFFMPVDPSRRVDCQCKETEETIVEPDGYRWTNPRPESGEQCRGCEMSAWPHGRPCSIHSSRTS